MTEALAMAVQTVGVSARAGRISAKEAPLSHWACGLGVVASVLRDLLRREVSPDEVGQRAIAFGLCRQPASGEWPTLNPQAISRLFLAAYRLPAYAEPAALGDLSGHGLAGRRVFVLFEADAVFRLPGLGLTEPAAAARQLALDRSNGGATTKHLSFVAASAWSDLPVMGNVFFGGSRGADGVLHWNSAECDTDATGRIVRF
jgi:hypothetical protein